MAARKCLNFDFDYFTDLSKQIAYKRYVNKKFWNVVLHTLTSCFILWSSFFLLSYLLPYFVMHLNVICILALCIKQDTILGLGASLLYPVLYYHALYISSASFLQTCSLVILMYLVQIYVGQKWLEGMEPFSQATKSVDVHFLLLDIYNEIFLSFFHNGITLFVRLGFNQDLRDRSDVILRKILDRVKKVP